ncbi:MAG: Tol-Pal system beta propeller repeat protein TolB [Desulfobacteraceae bacterium 4572_19]|nr:MAG: Tol-Pal system beta propeller repeat protein TolB [Desulfobacteraceae bacterium 4572_19]
MKKNIIVSICFVVILFVVALPCRAGYDYISISDPFIRKIPVAVPVFKSLTSNSKEDIVAKEASKILADALKFTGYFKIVDRGAYLEKPSQIGITKRTLKFKNWTCIGAEFLITGGVSIEENKLTMELRLFDTVKAKLLIGKEYISNIDEQRKMIHRFASQVVYYFTGSKGVFDTQIAFVSTGTGKKEIYTCDFDGNNPQKVTNAKSIALSPVWSSDGKWLAYTSYKNGKPDLFIKNLKGQNGYIIDKKGSNISPCWLPGQNKLAATLTFTGDPEIYLLTGTGKIIKRLTYSRGIDVSPSFSPDGNYMVYVSHGSGTPQLYIMNLETGKSRRLTYSGKYNTSPAWSPTGDKIAYVGGRDGHFNIYLIYVKSDGTADGAIIGGESVQLTFDAGDNEDPAWSPDGSLILFSSTRDGKSRIYVMTAAGTDQQCLLTLDGLQMDPAWSAVNENY